MARPAETLIGINVIDDAVNKIAYKDGNGDPLTNAAKIEIISDLSGAGAAAIVLVDLRVKAAPASSGTRYAAYGPGSTARDYVAGKLYIKTSAVGATDAWAVVCAQT